MKKINSQTKQLALLLGLFILSAFIVRAAPVTFKGPTTGVIFPSKDASPVVRSGAVLDSIVPDSVSSGAILPEFKSDGITPNANFTIPSGSTGILGRSLSIAQTGAASLVTEGLYSFGPVRSIGVLGATLGTMLNGSTPVNGVSPTRDVFVIKSSPESSLISFMANKPMVSFWSQLAFDPGFSPSFFDLEETAMTTLRLGRLNSTRLVVGNGSDVYGNYTKNLTLSGTTNLGKGETCYGLMALNGESIIYNIGDYNNSGNSGVYNNSQHSCPAGYYMKAPSYEEPFQGYGMQGEINFVCQAINPTQVPLSIASFNQQALPGGTTYGPCSNVAYPQPYNVPYTYDIMNQRLYEVTGPGTIRLRACLTTPNSNGLADVNVDVTLEHDEPAQGQGTSWDPQSGGQTSWTTTMTENIWIPSGNLCGYGTQTFTAGTDFGTMTNNQLNYTSGYITVNSPGNVTVQTNFDGNP